MDILTLKLKPNATLHGALETARGHGDIALYIGTADKKIFSR
jgi:hypothetical protein